MPKGSSKSIAQIQRLLEERRQYEAWLARLGAATDATPDQVRGRVRADYEARLEAVIEELKGDAAGARQAIEEKKDHRAGLQKKEASGGEKLTEDDKGAAPSPTRASGAQFQPVMPTETPRAPSSVRAATPSPAPILPQAGDGDEEAVKTLKCKECGTMNLPTEWYCESCGGELATL